MADGFYRLTYRDIADKLGISPDAARMKANRKAKAGHWRLLPDETPGQERLVEIPAADIDDAIAKAVRQAERSVPAAQPEQPAPAQASAPAERSASAEHPAPPEQSASPAAAERSATVEPFVPPKVSVSFDPQHPHLPPATAERSAQAQSSATPEPPASAERAEQAAVAATPPSPEQPAEAEQAVEAEQLVPIEQIEAAEQSTEAELVPEAEQVVEAEQAQAAEQLEGQPEWSPEDDDFGVNAEGETGDALVSTLTARVAKLTNRLLEETNARKKEREELNASAVREAELKVEIERLSARVAELTDTVEHGHRPWWRRLVQGSSAD